jgi:hypothetical protein
VATVEGAGQHPEVRVGVRGAGQLHGLVAVVDGDHEQRRLLDAGGVQQIRACRIAKVALDVHLAHVVDLLWCPIQHHRGHPVGAQQAVDDLPETADAGDDHRAALVDLAPRCGSLLRA